MKKVVFLLVVGLALLAVSEANAQISFANKVNVNMYNHSSDNISMGYAIMNSLGEVVGSRGYSFFPGGSAPRASYDLIASQNYILRVDYFSYDSDTNPGVFKHEFRIFSPQNVGSIIITYRQDGTIDINYGRFLSGN